MSTSAEGAIEKVSNEARLKRMWIEVLVIFLFGALPYLTVLDGPFLYDDKAYVVENVQVAQPERLLETLTSSYPPGKSGQGLYRPLTTVSYAFDRALAGFNPVVFHLSNLLLHAAACLAAYFLLRAWTPALAFSAALLFAVHPVHTEAVSWIVGRAEILCALFLFLSLRFAEERRILAAAFLLLALLSKEMAITAPALVLLPAVFLGKPLSTAAKSAVCFTIVAVGYLLLRMNALGGLAPGGGFQVLESTTLWERIPAVFECYAQYIRLALIPVGLSVDHPWYDAPSWGDTTVLVGFACLATIAFLLLVSRHKAPRSSLAAAWFLVALTPVSHVIPLGATYAERFLYTPSLGAVIFVAACLQRIRSRVAGRSLLVTILLGFTGASVLRNQIWRDEERFYVESLESSPDNLGLNHNLGTLYAERGEIDRAAELYEAVLIGEEDDAVILSNLGSIRLAQQRLPEAQALLERAVRIDPANPRAFYNLGLLYASQGRVTDARKALDRTLELDPTHEKARLFLIRLESLPGR